MTIAFPLPAELNIYGAAALRTSLLDLLKPASRPGDECVLCAAAVTEADACGIQLLIALRRSLAAQGRVLRLTEPSTALAQSCHTLGAGHLLHGPARSRT